MTVLLKWPDKGREKGSGTGLIQRFCPALEEFFRERAGMKGKREVKVVDDLILLRCKHSVSLAEVNLGTMKAGRLLRQGVGDRLCQEHQLDLNRLLRKITGHRLLVVSASLFFRQRERIYVFTMSDRIKH